MKRISHLLLVCGFVVVTSNLTACNKIDDVDIYENNTSDIKWNDVADSTTNALIEHFWHKDKHYFVYNSDAFYDRKHPGYWPQAHAMDVVIDAYLRTHDQRYAKLFPLWFEGIKKVNDFRGPSGYENNFYDDSEWIGLTMIRLYEVTKEEKYLNAAKQLWTWIQTGWNNKAGGGIAWEYFQNLHSKNACSNGPAAIMAARLYRITKDKAYLDWATKIYLWEKATLMNASTGAIYDNVNSKTDVIEKKTWTYNQGTFVGAAYELYQLTADKTFLNDSRKAAYYCISNASMLDIGNNLLKDEGTGDAGLFKGIFMRYFVLLIKEPNLDASYKRKFLTFFNHNAEILWIKGTNKKTFMMGPNWADVIQGTNELTTQSSACMTIEAKATLKP